MSLPLMLLPQYQLCSLIIVDRDSQLLHRMGLYAHVSLRWGEGVIYIQQNHLSALTITHRMSPMLVQVDQLLLQLVIAPTMLMLLYGIHSLHPPTSRASILCHEGGVRSLSVFANDIRCGSISPLIVKGRKGGDVGVHDFRYIPAKRHSTAGMQAKHGDQNRNGMLWYIPKSHSGSVTRISVIPNTSFFSPEAKMEM